MRTVFSAVTGTRCNSLLGFDKADDANTLPDSDVVNRIILPQDFQQRLTPLLVSGTTMMVTDAPILEHTTGQTMAIMSSHPGI